MVDRKANKLQFNYYYGPTSLEVLQKNCFSRASQNSVNLKFALYSFQFKFYNGCNYNDSLANIV